MSLAFIFLVGALAALILVIWHFAKPAPWALGAAVMVLALIELIRSIVGVVR